MLNISLKKRIVIFVFAVFLLTTGEVDAFAKRNVLFLHHSVGTSLIKDGRLRLVFSEAGFDFWDHGYNNPRSGLRDENGKAAGNYAIPDNDTTPYGYARLFQMDPSEDNALRRILENHEIILFKSCFPVNRIQEDDPASDKENPNRKSLVNYKRHYRSIRDAADRFPNHLFVILTAPPLHPDATNPVEATRARAFAEWLASREYRQGRANLFVFDFFDLLADPKTQTLRNEFQINPSFPNSHPNPLANLTIAPRIADFVINAASNVEVSNSVSKTDLIIEPIVRSSDRYIRIEMEIEGNRDQVCDILWSDMKGAAGHIDPSGQMLFRYGPLTEGVTGLLFTLIYQEKLRKSYEVAVRYHIPGRQTAVILNANGCRGIINGTSDLEQQKWRESGVLYLKGSGSTRRIVFDDIALDISSFDPVRSSIDFTFGDAVPDSPLLLIIPGILSTNLRPYAKTGEQRISIELSAFPYVVNYMNRIILKGQWPKNESVSIQSIQLVEE